MMPAINEIDLKSWMSVLIGTRSSDNILKFMDRVPEDLLTIGTVLSNPSGSLLSPACSATRQVTDFVTLILS